MTDESAPKPSDHISSKVGVGRQASQHGVLGGSDPLSIVFTPQSEDFRFADFNLFPGSINFRSSLCWST